MSRNPGGVASRSRRPARPAYRITRVASGVIGDVRVLSGVWSADRSSRRDLLIYLPPSYEHTSLRYPVLYMHDGQNLFDEATSYAGEWHVDKSMEALSRTGLEAIVVGVPNMQQQRAEEYSPFPDAKLGIAGRGAEYVTFLHETVKPLIDREFRTQPERATTGTAGSSMGALISLYAFFHSPEVFGFAGALSPALWPGTRAIFSFIEQAPVVRGRLYVDIGTGELPGAVRDARRLHRVLLDKGHRESDDLRYVEDEGAFHHEAAWARRFPAMIRFLLGHEPRL